MKSAVASKRCLPQQALLPRSAGVLVHITSLPSPFGIGDFGPEARWFVDLLSRADQTWWQILPLTPPAEGDSPYSSISAFAGNPLLISPEELVREGLLNRREIGDVHLPEGRVNYPAVRALKTRLLGQAWERWRSGEGRRLNNEFEAFVEHEAWWLSDFALYAALREANGCKPWTKWGKHLARRQPRALNAAVRDHAETMQRYRFEQFIFFRQLVALRDYAHSKGIRLIGDVPMFVSLDSADVWAHQEYFQLRADGSPKVVSGVPADSFSKEGQLWGTPLYDWDALAKDDYQWWVHRVSELSRYVDLVRLDHFRGLQACWAIPGKACHARNGCWVVSPGATILELARKRLGYLPMIAEDLGFITPEVEALRDRFQLPGMRIVQRAFDSDSANIMLPHNYTRNNVAYTGTHDDDTTLSWFGHLGARHRDAFRQYAPDARQDPVGALIRLAMASVADLAILPMQDILRLGHSARMNTPGTPRGNWVWRFRRDMVQPWQIRQLQHFTRIYGRGRRSSETM